jgi:hypothetical protein
VIGHTDYHLFPDNSYNYYADNGKIFMGRIYISCDQAAKAFKEFGQGRAETTAIYHRGNGPEKVEIPVLDLNGNKIPGSSRICVVL